VSAYRHWWSGLLAGAALVAAVTAVISGLEPRPDPALGQRPL